ncbi:MAG: helicase [Clostridia bacterium]|jgi:DNA helicase-2/ATP-dependent DNA helicase PcrA|nr:helicase [Clostridia bacterium]
MENNQYELEFENQRLEQTLSLAKSQLSEARKGNEENKSAIISAKKELRESTSHSISGLWSSEGFEALAALSQYVNPVMNKIADYESTENKILLLEQLIKSPYFARIDFKFDGEDVFEKIYIGRSSLMKEDSYEMFVYDWRSPIASVFYRFVMGPAFYEAPNGKITGEVNLKRQYEITQGVLEYFFDADVQIVDEFLRKLLSQNTSPRMKTIVETIQREQDIVIRDMESELMMVQGVAGSGKTSIALHRAAYLMYQGLSPGLSANNIVIISPNALFEQYISNVLPELGEAHVVSMVFEEILVKILENEHLQTRNQFLEHLITSSQDREIIKSSIEFKTSHQFLEIINRFIEELPYKWIVFDDVYYQGECIISKEILKDKILSGREKTPLGLKLKQLEDFVLELIREAHNNRINKSEEAIIKKEIQKFTELNAHNLYRKLLSDKNYFYSLAKELELPDCINDILIFTQENLYTDLLYYDDAAVIAYLTLKLNGTNEYKNIKQVVIDEAQDYYPLHYEIFHLLFPNAKYTILGDINQTLEKQEDLSLYEQISKILNKKKSSLITMDKSFRCTNEILIYGSKFIKQSLEIKSFNRKGDVPKIYAAGGQIALDDRIVLEVKSCLEKGYQSIGLICKSEKNTRSLFARLKGRMDIKLITNESTAALQGVFIIPVYMSKGLEFDAVLICDTDTQNYKSEDDKKLLYIACTRALHRLNLFCEGEVSPLLY